MLIDILLVIAAAVVVLAVVIALLPADFTVTRSVTMAAPPSTAFALVNDFHRWAGWSPYEKLDPGMKRTYSGPEAGQGAVYAWEGNKNVGSGRMTVVENRPAERVALKLEFFAPFKANNTATFTFANQPGGTVVTWSMAGRRNFMMKAMGLVMNFDKMIGGQFQEGLTSLKQLAEAAPKQG